MRDRRRAVSSRGRFGKALAVALSTVMAVSAATVSVVIASAQPAGASGVAFAPGDVLADVGGGQIRHFSSSGTLLDTLDTTTGTNEGDGMCFDSSTNLYATQGFSANTMSKFDSSGNLIAANWGSGFNAHPESCTVDASNNIYVGQPDGAHQVLKFDTAGNLLASYSPTIESRGTDWIDLASDQHTLYYTSEGGSVHRFDVSSNTQLADFASGLPSPCYELRIRPNGEVLVACTSVVVRLDTSGSVVQTYALPSTSLLFAMNLDPDNTSFWTADYFTGTIFHVDIATGSILGSFSSPPNSVLGGLLIVGGIVVSQPTLTLSPSTATQAVGTAHTVTATITNPGGSISGQTVNFSVSGANTATGSGTTNISGQATFTYTGTNPGGDTIKGSFTGAHGSLATGTASMTWTSRSTCTKAIGKGSTGPGNVGTVVNSLSTTLSSPQQFEFAWNNHAHHVNLVSLTRAKCGPNDRKPAPGLTFQGNGTATLDGVTGYTIQFFISNNSTGSWMVTVQIKKGSTIVNTFADTLTVSTEVIS